MPVGIIVGDHPIRVDGSATMIAAVMIAPQTGTVPRLGLLRESGEGEESDQDYY